MIGQTRALAVKQRDMLRLAACQAELRRRPRLRFLFLEMTDRCNLRCAHCGSGCGPEGGVFLPFAVMERVLRSTAARLRPEGIMICLTGGEPLLHPDVVRVIALSRGLGFACGITTNATLIDRNTARRMAAAGLDTVAISVDGAHEAHDAFRRAPGALSRALEGVRELRAVGLDPQAVTVVHAGNLARLEALDDFLRREGFTSWRLTNVDPIGRAAARPDLLLDGPGLRRLLDFIRDRRFRPGRDMEVTYGCAHFLGPADERMTGTRVKPRP